MVDIRRFDSIRKEWSAWWVDRIAWCGIDGSGPSRKMVKYGKKQSHCWRTNWIVDTQLVLATGMACWLVTQFLAAWQFCSKVDCWCSLHNSAPTTSILSYWIFAIARLNSSCCIQRVASPVSGSLDCADHTTRGTNPSGSPSWALQWLRMVVVCKRKDK